MIRRSNVQNQTDVQRGVLGMFFFLVSFGAVAQNQANNWYFGDHAGLNFNTASPSYLQDGQTDFHAPLQWNEGSSTISDSNGELLFYSNGETAWNKDHEVMLNGSNLMGHSSSTESSVIIPAPNSDRFFYLFTVDALENNFRNGIRYSIVDMCLDYGKGGILDDYKNVLLHDSVSEKLSVVRHTNGRDYWVLTHGYRNDRFISFLVTENGIEDTVVSKTGTPDPQGWGGQMIASPDGRKIAYAIPNAQSFGKTLLLDFNPGSGRVSNEQTLSSGGGEWGVSFSPDNTKLYFSTTGRGELFQYDLQAGNLNDIISSKVYLIKNGPDSWRDHRLGPDGKIYIARMGRSYLSAITNPNRSGTGCGYVDNAISLGNKKGSAGLPNVITGYSYSNKTPPQQNHYRSFSLGNDTSVCAGSGLMIGIQPSDSATYSWNTGEDSSWVYVNTSNTFILQVTDKNCFSLDTIVVSVDSLPRVDLVNDTAFCMTDSLVVEAKSQSTLDYTWSDGSKQSQIIIKEAGKYLVKFNDGNCKGVDSVIVRMDSSVSFSLGGDTSFCEGGFWSRDMTHLKANEYQWSSGSEHTFDTVRSTKVVWLTATRGTCTWTDTAYINVNEYPTFDLGSDTLICDTDSVRIGTAISFDNYAWEDGGVEKLRFVSKEGSYVLEVTQKSCSTSDTIFVAVDSVELIRLGNDTVLCVGSDLKVNGMVDHGVNYRWNDGPVATERTIVNAGMYVLSVETRVCGTLQDTINVAYRECPCEFWVPNAFSPNVGRDDLNTEFVPYFGCQPSSYSLSIYNRWGELIYQTTDINNISWDGSYDNKPVSSGVYIWKLEYRQTVGEVKNHSGIVHVVR